MLKLENIYKQSTAARLLGINDQTMRTRVKRMIQKGVYHYNEPGKEFTIVSTECGHALIFIEKKQ